MDNFKLRQQRSLDVINPEIEYSLEDFNNEFYPIPKMDLLKINLSFVNKSNNQDPEYATAGSSGFDLRANLLESVEILAGETKIIPTGLFFNIPENFEIQIRSRSGLAAKNNVFVLNSTGTIDMDYTGEILIILSNFSKTVFFVNHGDRIAQAIFAPVLSKNYVSLNKVEHINKITERGSGGIGHTGIK